MSDLSIFLSYNLSKTEMVVVWRFQTLAAAHGITVYVPHPQDRRGDRISGRAAQMIDASNIVVAFCTRELGQRVWQEIQYAIQKGKPVLPILEKGVTLPAPLSGFPVVSFDPLTNRSGDLENRIVEHLEQHRNRYQLKKKEANTVGVLLGIAAALLALWLLTKEG